MWNEFIKTHGPKSGAFLQSLEWAHFQSQTGRTVFYIASIGGEVKAFLEPPPSPSPQGGEKILDRLALAILMPISFGKKFLYVPRGPIGENGENIITLAAKMAAENKAIFLKVDPIKESGIRNQESSSIQPRQTVILDLTKSVQELLTSMHTKTRYNIALARRHNVRIEKASTDEQFNLWFLLMSATARRDGFHAHPKEYYKKLLEINGEMKTALWLAFDGDDLLAGNLTGYFNNTVTYLHGASNNTKRNLMAPFLLHWEIILDAQKNGYTAYDFWGIDEKKWPGITRFKQNFGNASTLREISYPKAFDIPLNKFWHFLYNVKRTLKH